MAVATTDDESAEPQDVLEQYAPLSRDSLKEREVVQALWREAQENSQTGAASVLETAEVYRGFAGSNAFEYEIATALDHFDVCNVPEQQTSVAFREWLK